MAQSWSELSADQKVVYLLEGLVENQVDDKSMACRVCNQIFTGNKSLVKHCCSHFFADGTLKPGLHVRNFVSSESTRNISSNSSPFGRSLPVEAGIGEYGANGFLEPSARQSVSQNPPNLSLASNYIVPTLLRNSMQLRGPILPRMPQPYPSPSILRSTINRGTSSSLPIQSPKSHSGFGPRPTLPPNFHSPVSPMAPGMYSSRTIKLSNFDLYMSFVSPPIKQSNFHLSINADASASHSVPGTKTRALGPDSVDAVDGCSSGYTKPYILQLELPVKKVMVGHNDEGGNDNPDGMDLDLKL